MVSNCRIRTITIKITRIGIFDLRTYVILGIFQCCQNIRISADGMANIQQWDSMGDYDYYGTDADGAVIYYNVQHNRFLTRDHIKQLWLVS